MIVSESGKKAGVWGRQAWEQLGGQAVSDPLIVFTFAEVLAESLQFQNLSSKTTQGPHAG